MPLNLTLFFYKISLHTLTHPCKLKGKQSSEIFISFELISGNTDAIMPVVPTRYSIGPLKLPAITPWHAWHDDGEVRAIWMAFCIFMSIGLYNQHIHCLSELYGIPFFSS